MRAFQAALAARPGDARALSELSFAAVSAGNYGAARDAAEKSIAAAGSNPPLLAASYYNLGRAAEGQQDLEGARKAYGASLGIRDSKEVRERLDKLGASGATLYFEGPFQKIEGFCQAHSKDQEWCEESDFLVSRAHDFRGSPRVAPPFLKIGFLKRQETGLPEVHFALRLSDGWYVSDAVANNNNKSFFELTRLQMVGNRLVIRTRSGHDDRHYLIRTTETIYVCGLSVNKKPRCIGMEDFSGDYVYAREAVTVHMDCPVDYSGGEVLEYGPPPKTHAWWRAGGSSSKKNVPARPDFCVQQQGITNRKFYF